MSEMPHDYRTNPVARLRYHVSGAIARGETEPVAEQTVYHMPRGWMVWASVDTEEHAAAIVRRLNEDEGLEADYMPADQLYADGWPVRSSYRYHVIVERTDTEGRALAQQ